MEELEFFGRLHKKREGMAYLSVRAISACVNLNYDAWPPKELASSYKTFRQGPIFVDHISFEEDRARGIVLDSEYVDNPDDKVIWLLLEVDIKTFPKLGKELLSGGLDSVSMGAMVEISICSICGNEAKENEAFCVHIPKMKGQTVGGKLCYEICKGVTFYEISLVFEPADVTAVAKTVVAAIGTNSGGYSYAPQTRTIDINQYGQQKPIDIVDVFPYSFSNNSDPSMEAIFEIDPYAIVENEIAKQDSSLSDLL